MTSSSKYRKCISVTDKNESSNHMRNKKFGSNNEIIIPKDGSSGGFSCELVRVLVALNTW